MDIEPIMLKTSTLIFSITNCKMYEKNTSLVFAIETFVGSSHVKLRLKNTCPKIPKIPIEKSKAERMLYSNKETVIC